MFRGGVTSTQTRPAPIGFLNIPPPEPPRYQKNWRKPIPFGPGRDGFKMNCHPYLARNFPKRFVYLNKLFALNEL